MQIHLDTIGLVIFGDFGVLSNTPFKDHQPLHMLPGRAEYLAFLQNDRDARGQAPLLYAVTGNKGGVAWDAQSEEEAIEEVRWTAEQIGSTHYRYCFACPTTQVGYERYKAPEMLARRKPRPPMFAELIEELGVAAERVLIVDHYSDSFSGARKLGCAWMAPGSFFANAAQHIPVSRREVLHELALLDLSAVEEDAPPLTELDLFDIDTFLAHQEENG